MSFPQNITNLWKLRKTIKYLKKHICVFVNAYCKCSVRVSEWSECVSEYDVRKSYKCALTMLTKRAYHKTLSLSRLPIAQYTKPHRITSSLIRSHTQLTTSAVPCYTVRVTHRTAILCQQSYKNSPQSYAL